MAVNDLARPQSEPKRGARGVGVTPLRGMLLSDGDPSSSTRQLLEEARPNLQDAGATADGESSSPGSQEGMSLAVASGMAPLFQGNECQPRSTNGGTVPSSHSVFFRGLPRGRLAVAEPVWLFGGGVQRPLRHNQSSNNSSARL